jgi:hypothetical protein
MPLKDRDIVSTALKSAALIVGDHVEPGGPKDPVVTIKRLIEVFGRSKIVGRDRTRGTRTRSKGREVAFRIIGLLAYRRIAEQHGTNHSQVAGTLLEIALGRSLVIIDQVVVSGDWPYRIFSQSIQPATINPAHAARASTINPKGARYPGLRSISQGCRPLRPRRFVGDFASTQRRKPVRPEQCQAHTRHHD